MSRTRKLGWIVCAAMVCAANAASAQNAEKAGLVGVRLGIGTDITGGIAYGAQLNYTLDQNPNAFELGLAVYGGKFEESTDEGMHTYDEETSIFVIGAMANYLFRHALELSGPYFLAGIGVGAMSVEWEERSTTDTSLGTPLPGGGSMQDDDGTAAGLILNFGIGHRFNERLDLRFQVPTFFISGSDDRDGKTVPTFTLTAGLFFG
jgi:hypothetical protein